MNILFLHSSSDLYGASRILIYTIEAILKDNPKTVCIVCLSEDGLLKKALEEIGVLVLIVDLGILRRRYFNLFGLINRVVVLIKAFLKLRKIVKERKINVIYSNTTAVIIGCLAARILNIFHIFHIHEIIDKPIFLYRMLKLFIKKFSNKNIMVSSSVYNHWVGDSLLLKINSLVIYNGIEIREADEMDGNLLIDLPKTEITIGMVARVHYWKGQTYFIKIASHILKEIGSVKFIMIGDAYPGYEYLYDEMSSLKKELNIEDKMFDLGYKKDAIPFINEFDLLILPSIKPDPFPTVILEAMSMSTPVAATQHGGALEMIENNITGFHLPYDNAAKAAEIVVNGLRDKNIKDMGKTGNIKLQRDFSLKSFQKKIANFFNGLKI